MLGTVRGGICRLFWGRMGGFDVGALGESKGSRDMSATM